MESTEFTINHLPPVSHRKNDIVLHIYTYLNQGNLFRIYQLLDNIRNRDEQRLIEDLFVKKFGFNYRNFI